MSQGQGRQEFTAAETIDDSFEEVVESRQKFGLGQLEEVSIFHKDKVPKANEIVNTARDVKKSIYSFKIQAELLPEQCTQNQQLFLTRKQAGKVQQKRTLLLEHFRHHLIYDKYSTAIDSFFELSIFSLDKIRQMRKADMPMNFFAQESKPLVVEDNLSFDSRFESGNLAFVSKHSQRTYNLLLQNDVNTNGYSNWFYFKVSNKTKAKAKFSILNYGKAGWLYNEGMGVLTYSRRAFEMKGEGWVRTHNNVCCFRNNSFRSETSTISNYNTLTFEYDFSYDQDDVYFAYSIPYTYTELCSFLDDLEGKALPFFHRKMLGRSLAGNRLEILTISNGENWKKDAEECRDKSAEKPAIVIIARSHPGETVSSWILKGLIEFIVGTDPTAVSLRERFVFKIIPMMNPDGVIHGNYRCSLSGRDLNRRWKKPDRNLYPEVYFAKKLIYDIGCRRNIDLVMDLHGHSRRKKMFMYGCNDWMNPMKCREFPYLLSKLNPNFQYRYCNFLIQKYKESTARVTLFRKFKIPTIFTLQSSMCGNVQAHFSIKDLKDMGVSLAQAINVYFKAHKSKKDPCQTKQDTKCHDLLKQLWENEELMKVGNDKDQGSESEPSLDNIPISQINKICIQRDRRSSRTVASTIQKPRQLSSNAGHRDNKDRSTNSLSKTAVIIKSSNKASGNLFEKSLNKTTDGWRETRKPVSARRNLNTLNPPPPMCRQQYQFSKKYISFEQKSAREVRFINFPLVDDFLKFHNNNFVNKDSKAHKNSQEQQSAQKSIHSQCNSFRLRNFVRMSKNRRFLFKGNLNV